MDFLRTQQKYSRFLKTTYTQYQNKVLLNDFCNGLSFEMRLNAALLREIVDRTMNDVDWGLERARLCTYDFFLPKNMKWYMYNLLKVCISKNIFWTNIIEQNQRQNAHDCLTRPDFENEINDFANMLEYDHSELDPNEKILKLYDILIPIAVRAII